MYVGLVSRAMWTVDALYIIDLRIGEDMARIHLSPLAIGFFSALDKLRLGSCWARLIWRPTSATSGW